MVPALSERKWGRLTLLVTHAVTQRRSSGTRMDRACHGVAAARPNGLATLGAPVESSRLRERESPSPVGVLSGAQLLRGEACRQKLALARNAQEGPCRAVTSKPVRSCQSSDDFSSTSFATVTTIALHDGDMRKPIAKKVVPTTGVTDATMSFVDLKPSESLSCEVRVDAELGAARVQVRVDY